MTVSGMNKKSGNTITVFKGDGIGPEITDAVLSVLDAAGAGLTYEIFSVGEKEYEEHGALIPEEGFQSFERTGVLLKSPITTPVGKGFRSLNVMLGKNMTYMPISARQNPTRRSRRRSPMWIW